MTDRSTGMYAGSHLRRPGSLSLIPKYQEAGEAYKGVIHLFDKELARKFLNKIQKDAIELDCSIDTFNDKQERLLKGIISKIDLMYDILHLDDIEVINLNRGK